MHDKGAKMDIAFKNGWTHLHEIGKKWVVVLHTAMFFGQLILQILLYLAGCQEEFA